MGVQRWQVGAVTITQVVESRNTIPPGWLFEGLTPEQVIAHRWMRPRYADDRGHLHSSIHAFIVESAGLRIVVDTCVGNDKVRAVPGWHLRQGHFLHDLAAAGFAPETIDRVLCTHLHVDHVGWNTRLAGGRWVPTFPRAQYLFGRVEWRHWSAEGDAAQRQVLADSVQPIVDAGLHRFVEQDHAITDEVRLEPTPGHTPGHVSVHVASDGETAVITGDLLHHPVQVAEPALCSRFDWDADLTRQVRGAFLQRHGHAGALVLGTHFPEPSAGRLQADGTRWRFVPDDGEVAALRTPADGTA